jgi:hypothetical protein
MSRRRWAGGRKARAIDQRSGFEFPYKYLIREPGTKLLIDGRESDGRYNLVDHPQNFQPKDVSDTTALRNATGGPDLRTANSDQIIAPLRAPNGRRLVDANGNHLTICYDKKRYIFLRRIGC